MKKKLIKSKFKLLRNKEKNEIEIELKKLQDLINHTCGIWNRDKINYRINRIRRLIHKPIRCFVTFRLKKNRS